MPDEEEGVPRRIIGQGGAAIAKAGGIARPRRQLESSEIHQTGLLYEWRCCWLCKYRFYMTKQTGDRKSKKHSEGANGLHGLSHVEPPLCVKVYVTTVESIR